MSLKRPISVDGAFFILSYNVLMIFNFILVSMLVATFSLLVRNYFVAHKKKKVKIQESLPHWLSHAITCGFCNTYWLALITMTLLVNPFDKIDLPVTSLFGDGSIKRLAIFMIGWAALGLTAALWRFTYVLLQEMVFHLVHILNKHR